MAAKSRNFPEESSDSEGAIHMSDAELEALLMGGPAPSDRGASIDALEPGSRIEGLVVEHRGGETLVELDGKTHGVVDESELEGEEPPRVGERIRATFLRFDAQRDLAILSIRGAVREIFWEEIRPGMVLEGRVSGCNKGGLTLDLKGVRAFLPISQIERGRVEDTERYVGSKLRCEVTSVDRERRDVVVSRRVILDREAEELRGKALARLSEGETLTGVVTRVNEHGAFIDLGGVEGLLHRSKIRERHEEIGEGEALEPGQRLEVVVARVDRERERIGLDFRRLAGQTWNRSVEEYAVGDEMTGWIARVTPEGAWVRLDDEVEGLLPRSTLLDQPERPSRGTILRVVLTRIDPEARRIELRPAPEGEPA